MQLKTMKIILVTLVHGLAFVIYFSSSLSGCCLPIIVFTQS